MSGGCNPQDHVSAPAFTPCGCRCCRRGTWNETDSVLFHGMKRTVFLFHGMKRTDSVLFHEKDRVLFHGMKWTDSVLFHGMK